MTELTGQARNLTPDWKSIPKEWLVPKAKLINLFISARLMPATSHGAVAKRRALLIYSISMGFTVNVGRIIKAEMKSMTNPKQKTDAIGFLSLISRLCQEAGLVESHDPAQRIPLMTKLTWKAVNKPSKTGVSSSRSGQMIVSGQQEQQGQEQNQEQNEQEQGQQQEEGIESSSSEKELSVTEALECVMDAVDQLLTEHRSLVTKHEQLVLDHARLQDEVNKREDTHADFIRYQVAFNMWMAAGQHGEPPVYPSPPILLPPPPPSPPTDEPAT